MWAPVAADNRGKFITHAEIQFPDYFEDGLGMRLISMYTCSLEDEGDVTSDPREILEPNQCSVHPYRSTYMHYIMV